MKELYNGRCIAVVEAIGKNPFFGLDMSPSRQETEQSLERTSFQLCIFHVIPSPCSRGNSFSQSSTPKKTVMIRRISCIHGICITYHIMHIHVYLYTRQFVPHCFPAVERCLSTVEDRRRQPLSPKVMACAGGPNALAAISLSRGTLVFTPCIDTHEDTYTHGFDSCPALFFPTHLPNESQSKCISIGCRALILWETVLAPANGMIMIYKMVTIWIT